MDHGGSACFEVDFSFLLAKHHREKNNGFYAMQCLECQNQMGQTCAQQSRPRTNFGPAK